MTEPPLKKQWLRRPLNPSRLEAAVRYAEQTVLDVGCGNGNYVMALAAQDHDAVGVDVEPYDSWQLAPDRFQVADAASLPFPDESVDTLLSFEVLEHVVDPIAVLEEFRRVVRNHVILTVPNCDVPQALAQSGLGFYHFTDRSHQHFFSLPELESLLEQNGFSVVESRLINQVNLADLMVSSLAGPAWLWRQIANRLQRREYMMTCLVVALKINGVQGAAR